MLVLGFHVRVHTCEHASTHADHRHMPSPYKDQVVTDAFLEVSCNADLELPLCIDALGNTDCVCYGASLI